MQFRRDINAPAKKVYATTIGKETFKKWTFVFNPTSDFETDSADGSWEKGAKIRFIGLNEEGKKEGMVGYIRENVPAKFVSIEYVGVLDGDMELTEGPVAEEWRGFENYTFEDHGETASIVVDLDVNDQMIDYFGKTYPEALNKLKAICEA